MSNESFGAPSTGLFGDLNPKELETLFSISKEKKLESGQFLIHEGERSSEVYIVVEGTLEVVKQDPNSHKTFVIQTLTKDDCVGELALLDQDVRSASVRAQGDVVLREIDTDQLKKKLKEDPAFFSIYERLARNVSKKLRVTNQKTVDALQHRVMIGELLIWIVVFMSMVTSAVKPLSYILSKASSSTHVSIPVMLLFTVAIFLYMWVSKIPIETFGLTLKNWKRSLYEGVVFTIPAIVLLLVLKLILIYTVPELSGAKLFNPYGLITDPNHKTLSFWIVANILYLLFIPAQELMARGTLQSLMEQFLTMQRKVPVAIIASNLIFSVAHVFISEIFAIFSFLIGCYIGWIYSRTHNLIGAIASHVIMGLWATTILGPF